MRLAEFDYQLPEELIAQQPLADRAASRMLVLYREQKRWEDRLFRDLPSFLSEGDCLVLNDSKVFPSRLFGRRMGIHSLPVGKRNPKRWENLSGTVEVFLAHPVSSDGLTWEALVRPGRKMRTGEVIFFDETFSAEIVGRDAYGLRTVRLRCEGGLFETLDRVGHVPLPPYIHRADVPEDRDRYQTVFARATGSVAAPTAGLHFTPETLAACRSAGAGIAHVTLHVGLGTFQPLRTEVVEQAKLHSEVFVIADEDARRMREARRLVAVGTTSVRTLETVARGGPLRAAAGETDIFIFPGFEFRATGAMLTNFHLPRSSLLLLVCAFGGADLVLAAYRHAVEAGYRFYSYGDCMLLV
ncbi:MAG: tRNA preQ1(34) S-adenosylmethionine ribosyltransferase-isomerase QueA [Bryobacteraceae bacterium]|nr:tRNA preQ1(34) S-adenosylmethionine ribosyltransferase-isomerase QueA [Bryobacteraceae bacterium]